MPLFFAELYNKMRDERVMIPTEKKFILWPRPEDLEAPP